ncbi:MAG: ABC transporter ATP-binding protein [Leptolyngbyaceae bacterium]|nr:ABC transporter ATP-binding protein [Leptolyngbyaceae bacterium]
MMPSSPTDPRPIISTQSLDMVFRNDSQNYHVLKHIDLDVVHGDVQLLMGPSGSGKTTLLSILGGILTPTSGQVTILGQNITQLSRTQLANFRRQHIGFVFQGFNLFPALTASENVTVAMKLKGLKSHTWQKSAIALLEQVGLGDKVNAYPHDLSGGQKQRVAIARALVGNPAIIMADEPTAALDSHSGHTVISLLRNLAKEDTTTVLMVTHDPRIKDIADRIAYLEDGMLKNH